MSTGTETRTEAWKHRLASGGQVDFTMMYIAHDAFSRDLTRLVATAESGQGRSPAAIATWRMFSRQLHTHHGAEDKALWPRLAAVVTDPDETRILEDMESEHASLDPRVERIDAAIAGPSSAALASERLLAGRDGDVRRPVGFLILGLIVATIITPDFIRLSNIDSLLVDNSSLLVIAVGEAFVIMVGSIDLGVESILVSAGMLIAWLTVFHGMPSGLAIVMTLAAAVVIGLLVGCWWPRCTFPPSWSRSASTGASAVSPC